MIDRCRLSELARELGVPLSEEQLAKFSHYANRLTEENRKVNLTAVTDPKEIVLRHFADSLTLVPFIPPNARVIDVGTGAGFPGAVLAIARPDIRLTCLDSLQKRLNFLDGLCRELDICAATVHVRAEDGGHMPELRGQFDFATARAVAALPVLCEYCLPFVKPGGLFVAMKGPGVESEIPAAQNAAKMLSAVFRQAVFREFPAHPKSGECALQRQLVIFQKTGETKKAYPRSPGKIKRVPLDAKSGAIKP